MNNRRRPGGPGRARGYVCISFGGGDPVLYFDRSVTDLDESARVSPRFVDVRLDEGYGEPHGHFARADGAIEHRQATWHLKTAATSGL